jgi:hypothetical protein
MLLYHELIDHTQPFATVGATRQGLTRALSGKTLLLDITTDGMEESPLRMTFSLTYTCAWRKCRPFTHVFVTTSTLLQLPEASELHARAAPKLSGFG